MGEMKTSLLLFLFFSISIARDIRARGADDGLMLYDEGQWADSANDAVDSSESESSDSSSADDDIVLLKKRRSESPYARDLTKSAPDVEFDEDDSEDSDEMDSEEVGEIIREAIRRKLLENAFKNMITKDRELSSSSEDEDSDSDSDDDSYSTETSEEYGDNRQPHKFNFQVEDPKVQKPVVLVNEENDFLLNPQFDTERQSVVHPLIRGPPREESGNLESISLIGGLPDRVRQWDDPSDFDSDTGIRDAMLHILLNNDLEDKKVVRWDQNSMEDSEDKGGVELPPVVDSQTFGPLPMRIRGPADVATDPKTHVILTPLDTLPLSVNIPEDSKTNPKSTLMTKPDNSRNNEWMINLLHPDAPQVSEVVVDSPKTADDHLKKVVDAMKSNGVHVSDIIEDDSVEEVHLTVKDKDLVEIHPIAPEYKTPEPMRETIYELMDEERHDRYPNIPRWLRRPINFYDVIIVLMTAIVIAYMFRMCIMCYRYRRENNSAPSLSFSNPSSSTATLSSIAKEDVMEKPPIQNTV